MKKKKGGLVSCEKNTKNREINPPQKTPIKCELQQPNDRSWSIEEDLTKKSLNNNLQTTTNPTWPGTTSMFPSLGSPSPKSGRSGGTHFR